jgi:DNA-binding MltR family transcriptional regulator
MLQLGYNVLCNNLNNCYNCLTFLFQSREIVNDVVEDFLNLYFVHDDVVEKGTYKYVIGL